MSSVLEVCAFHIQSCIIAEKCGAVRVELCDNPIEGGTTPSYGTIKQVKEKIAIKLYPKSARLTVKQKLARERQNFKFIPQFYKVLIDCRLLPLSF